MRIETKENLRTRLRDETRKEHESLDAKVTCANVATPDGLRMFLTMQGKAMQLLHPVATNAVCAPVLEDLLNRTLRDLDALGALPLGALPPLGTPPHPMAIDYVVSGSRLGGSVLKRRWQSSSAPEVRRVAAYFSASAYTDYWRAFCQRAELIPPDGPDSDQIVLDARRVFSLYDQCLTAFDPIRSSVNV